MIYTLKTFKFSSHYRIVNLVEKNKKVLDVACASGYLANLLKQKGCIVYGIDINNDYIDKAKKYCDNVSVVDISKERILGKYDVIVLGDILEHLSNPDEILFNLKNNLNNNGYIIISIPNIVNIYPRLKIFFGNFDYEEKGIFDKTHLRFFTKKSFMELIKKNGFKIEKIEYTPIPLDIKFPNLPYFLISPFYFLLHILSLCWPSLFAYQFVAKIKVY